MSVIRLRAGQACPVCGSTTGLPHASLRDCESASQREPHETLARPVVGHVDRTLSERRLKTVVRKRA
jgi:hypothetical protein